MGQELPPIITWDEAWSIGIAEIDEHHHKLVELIQRLFGALITAQGTAYMEEIVIELVDYTKFHFSREEEVYQEYGFDQLEHHKGQHQALIKQVLDVTQDVLKRGPSEELSEEVYYFLRHWLVDHIIDEDLKFKAFLENRA
jgi:hemerythrin